MKSKKKARTSKSKTTSSANSPGLGLSTIGEKTVHTISEGLDRVGSEFQSVARSSSARKAVWFIGGAATGVALAYLLDPSAGSERRSKITGKFGSLKQGISDMTREQVNGLSGVVSEYVAKGLSAIKSGSVNRDDSENRIDDSTEKNSRLASHRNSKNYNGYQENSYPEQ
jgi:hypothetical protein